MTIHDNSIPCIGCDECAPRHKCDNEDIICRWRFHLSEDKEKNDDYWESDCGVVANMLPKEEIVTDGMTEATKLEEPITTQEELRLTVTETGDGIRVESDPIAEPTHVYDMKSNYPGEKVVILDNAAEFEKEYRPKEISDDEWKARLRQYGWLRDDGDGKGEYLHSTRPETPVKPSLMASMVEIAPTKPEAPNAIADLLTKRKAAALAKASLMIATTTKLVELGCVCVDTGTHGSFEFQIDESRFWVMQIDRVDVILRMSEPTSHGFCPEMRLAARSTPEVNELNLTEFVLAAIGAKKVAR